MWSTLGRLDGNLLGRITKTFQLDWRTHQTRIPVAILNLASPLNNIPFQSMSDILVWKEKVFTIEDRILFLQDSQSAPAMCKIRPLSLATRNGSNPSDYEILSSDKKSPNSLRLCPKCWWRLSCAMWIGLWWIWLMVDAWHWLWEMTELNYLRAISFFFLCSMLMCTIAPFFWNKNFWLYDRYKMNLSSLTQPLVPS